jgi:heme A synthase
LIGVTLTGVLAAAWNDDRERGLAARITKFIILVVLVGAFVGFFAVALHVRCVSVVGPAWPSGHGAAFS